MKDRQGILREMKRWAVGALRFCSPALLFSCSLALASPALAQPTLDELLELDPPAETPADTEPTRDDGEPAEADAAPDAQDDPAADPEALAKRLEELRKKAAEDYKQAANALEEAVQQMDDVSKRLAEAHDPSVRTQRVQEQIIKKIEQMIAAAKQQQQQSSSSSSSQQQQQRQEDAGTAQMQSQSQSQSTSGQPQGNEAHKGGVSPGSVSSVGDTQQPIEELKREWGQLPPRLRDELTEGIGERFSPVYRLMTEAYYRRLAEEAGE